MMKNGTNEIEIETLSFHHDRILFHPSKKPPGMFRILFIGDSMTFGVGTKISETLPAHLSRILNGALPDTWVECLNMGVPGSCLFGDLGRYMSHGKLLSADLVIFCFCSNDAYMMRGQPAALTEIGRTWLEFRPTIESAMAFFKEQEASVFKSKFIFVYLDILEKLGDVDPTAILFEICKKSGVPFISAPPVFEGYDKEQLKVSGIDGHLGSHAFRIFAQHLARFLIENKYLPETKGYSDAGWIESFVSYMDGLSQCGVFPLYAPILAGQMLDEKWNNRKNKWKKKNEETYLRIRDDIKIKQNEHLTPASIGAASKYFGMKMQQGWELFLTKGIDGHIFHINTLLFALSHFIATEQIGQDLNEIEKEIVVTYTKLPPMDNTGLARCFREENLKNRTNAAARDESLRKIFDIINKNRKVYESTDIESFKTTAAKLIRFNMSLYHTTEIIDALAAKIVPEKITRDAKRLIWYFIDRLGFLNNCIAIMTHHLEKLNLFGIDAWNIQSPLMTLKLETRFKNDIEQTPPVYFLLNSTAECISPSHVISAFDYFYLNPDGMTKIYEIDVPFFILGKIIMVVNATCPDPMNPELGLEITSALLQLDDREPIDLLDKISKIEKLENRNAWMFEIGPIYTLEGVK